MQVRAGLGGHVFPAFGEDLEAIKSQGHLVHRCGSGFESSNSRALKRALYIAVFTLLLLFVFSFAKKRERARREREGGEISLIDLISLISLLGG